MEGIKIIEEGGTWFVGMKMLYDLESKEFMIIGYGENKADAIEDAFVTLMGTFKECYHVICGIGKLIKAEDYEGVTDIDYKTFLTNHVYDDGEVVGWNFFFNENGEWVFGEK